VPSVARSRADDRHVWVLVEVVHERVDRARVHDDVGLETSRYVRFGAAATPRFMPRP